MGVLNDLVVGILTLAPPSASRGLYARRRVGGGRIVTWLTERTQMEMSACWICIVTHAGGLK